MRRLAAAHPPSEASITAKRRRSKKLSCCMLIEPQSPRTSENCARHLPINPALYKQMGDEMTGASLIDSAEQHNEVRKRRIQIGLGARPSRRSKASPGTVQSGLWRQRISDAWAAILASMQLCVRARSFCRHQLVKLLSAPRRVRHQAGAWLIFADFNIRVPLRPVWVLCQQILTVDPVAIGGRGFRFRSSPLRTPQDHDSALERQTPRCNPSYRARYHPTPMLPLQARRAAVPR